MRIDPQPVLVTTMALQAASGSNRTWAFEYRRSGKTPIEWASGLRWKATDFKGQWSAFYLLVVAEAGPQETIDGRIVNNPVATGMWSGCSLAPKFATEHECQQWIDDHGLATGDNS